MSEEKRGHEPQSFAQRVQTVTVIIGALCAAWAGYQSQRTYNLAARQEHDRKVQTAIEHLNGGAPEGAEELRGLPGTMPLLVASVAPTGTCAKGWPATTRAVLGVIYDRSAELTAADRATLRRRLEESGAGIDRLLAEYPTPGAAAQLLSDHLCVQLALQHVTGATPGGWPQISRRLTEHRVAAPPCW